MRKKKRFPPLEPASVWRFSDGCCCCWQTSWEAGKAPTSLPMRILYLQHPEKKSTTLKTHCWLQSNAFKPTLTENAGWNSSNSNNPHLYAEPGELARREIQGQLQYLMLQNWGNLFPHSRLWHNPLIGEYNKHCKELLKNYMHHN